MTLSSWSFSCHVTEQLIFLLSCDSERLIISLLCDLEWLIILLSCDLNHWSFYCHVILSIHQFIVMWSWVLKMFLFFRELIETMLIFYTSLMTKSLTRHVFSLPLFDVLHHLLCVVSKQESYDLPLLQHGLQCLLHVTAKTRYMYMYYL